MQNSVLIQLRTSLGKSDGAVERRRSAPFRRRIAGACTEGGIATVGRRATPGATTRDHSIARSAATHWNIGDVVTATRTTARAVHRVIALTGTVVVESGGAEVVSTIESMAVRAWWMLNVDRPVDGLHAETAGDHVA